MSRIGKKPIAIPSGVKVAVADRTVTVEGKLGNLSFTYRPEVEAKVEGDEVIVTRKMDDRQGRALHGLTRSLIANMVEGVSKGYEKKLEVYGVGYGVQLQGNTFTVTCGKSHPEILEVPAGVTVDVETPQARGDSDPAKFTVKGPDKQMVGEFAAKCRRTRPPEPYKGKGVRYADEYVRRKVGKAFAGSGG
ncbi:MAG: 50S ribosomal protein L6 [Phycisphaerae bacterium]|nr:50S ribosomal protein L6 [Phycisphaerae bacterium]